MLRQWWKRHTDDADEGRPPRNSRWCSLRGGGGDFGVVLGACVRGVYELLQDAAAAGARAFAVDDTGGESKARTAVMAAAGGSATVRFERGADFVTVTVQCPVVPDPTGVLPTRVTGKATRYF